MKESSTCSSSEFLLKLNSLKAIRKLQLAGHKACQVLTVKLQHISIFADDYVSFFNSRFHHRTMASLYTLETKFVIETAELDKLCRISYRSSEEFNEY
jgi:hypothetical protein